MGLLRPSTNPNPKPNPNHNPNKVHWEELTATEQLRMKGMVASGAVGGVF